MEFVLRTFESQFDHKLLKNAEFRTVCRNSIFNLPGPKQMVSPYSPTHKFKINLCQGFMEIQKSHDVLISVRTYFASSPRGVQPSQYLSFLIHAYLNEAYIIEERMGKYLKRLTRSAGKYSDVRLRLEKIEPILEEKVEMGFKQLNLKESRNSHVHKQKHSDPGCGRLATWELLLSPPGWSTNKEYKKCHKAELKIVRQSWDEVFVENELSIKELLDEYFGSLLDAICKDDDTLRSFE